MLKTYVLNHWKLFNEIILLKFPVCRNLSRGFQPTRTPTPTPTPTPMPTPMSVETIFILSVMRRRGRVSASQPPYPGSYTDGPKISLKGNLTTLKSTHYCITDVLGMSNLTLVGKVESFSASIEPCLLKHNHCIDLCIWHSGQWLCLLLQQSKFEFR